MVEKRDAFLREVDEEVRKEQLLQLWKRFGTLIVALVVLAVGGVGWWQWSKSRTLSQAEAAGARFEAAARDLGDAPSDAALKVFSQIAADSPRGYRALARLRIASEHIKAARPGDALAEYEAIGKEQTFDPILREFAQLQAALLRLDTADWTEIENRLTPLIDGASAWRSPAREALAIGAIRAGKTDVARKQLDALLADRNLPQQMSERVQLLLALLTDQEGGKPAAAEKGGAQDSKSATTVSKK